MTMREGGTQGFSGGFSLSDSKKQFVADLSSDLEGKDFLYINMVLHGILLVLCWYYILLSVVLRESRVCR